MATGTIGVNATINETASTQVLAAQRGRVSIIVTNLSASDMYLARGTAAVIGQGVLLRSRDPMILTSDPDRTGTDNPIADLSVNVIATTGAGAGLSVAYEVISV